MFKWYYKVLVNYYSKYLMTAVTFYVKGFRRHFKNKHCLYIDRYILTRSPKMKKESFNLMFLHQSNTIVVIESCLLKT